MHDTMAEEEYTLITSCKLLFHNDGGSVSSRESLSYLLTDCLQYADCDRLEKMNYSLTCCKAAHSSYKKHDNKYNYLHTVFGAHNRSAQWCMMMTAKSADERNTFYLFKLTVRIKS